MIDCLKLKKTDKVLEVGTGTGYQTAIISYLCQEIYTVEIFNELLFRAKNNTEKLKIKNIIYKLGNGVNGWEEKILFDAIIVSATSEEISSKLLFNARIGRGSDQLVPSQRRRNKSPLSFFPDREYTIRVPSEEIAGSETTSSGNNPASTGLASSQSTKPTSTSCAVCSKETTSVYLYHRCGLRCAIIQIADPTTITAINQP